MKRNIKINAGGAAPPTHKDKDRGAQVGWKPNYVGGNKVPCSTLAPYTTNIMQERALKMEIKSNGAAPPPPTLPPTHTQKTNSKENARIRKQTEQKNKVVLKMVASTQPLTHKTLCKREKMKGEIEKICWGGGPPTHKDKDRGAQIG